MICYLLSDQRVSFQKAKKFLPEIPIDGAIISEIFFGSMQLSFVFIGAYHILTYVNDTYL